MAKITLAEMQKMIAAVQAQLVSSHDLVDRLEFPYYHSHASAPDILVRYKQALSECRGRISQQLDSLDKQEIYKSWLSPAADFNNLAIGSFFHDIVASLVMSSFGIGECAEHSCQLAIKLAANNFDNLAFVSLQFTEAKKGMEKSHQFILANLDKPPERQASQITYKQLLASLPSDVIVADPLLGVCFYPQEIPQKFSQFIQAYGGKAEVIGFRHFFNLTSRSFGGYSRVATDFKQKFVKQKSQSLPSLKEFLKAKDATNNLKQKKIDNKKAEILRCTFPIKSEKAKSYLVALDMILGKAADERIVLIDNQQSNVSFPNFWLEQLGEIAIVELTTNLQLKKKLSLQH